MTQEIEDKIKTLEAIRKDIAEGAYLNPFKGKGHILFLLSLLDELTDALFQIHQTLQEKRKHDPDINPSNKQSADPLPS